MNPSQDRAVESHIRELQGRLTPSIGPFLADVLAQRIIDYGQYEDINRHIQSSVRCSLLLDFLRKDENGFITLLNFLRKHGSKLLADDLEKEATKSEKEQGTTTDSKREPCAGAASAASERQADKKKAIKENLKDLVETLEGEVGFLVTHMELEEALTLEMKQALEVEKTDKAKLVVLFGWFKVRDKCWEALIDYLKIHHQSLATKLETSAGIA